MKQKKFWMIFRDTHDGTVNNNPTKKQLSYKDAWTEAKRLALKHPGDYFYVLKTITCYAGQARAFRLGLEK